LDELARLALEKLQPKLDTDAQQENGELQTNNLFEFNHLPSQIAEVIEQHVR